MASTVALLLGTVLLLLGASAAVVHYRATSSLAAVERAREDALRGARDAGLPVDEVAEIPAAVESFRGRLERRSEQRTRLETELEQLRDQLAEARSEVSDLGDANRRRRRSIAETIESAGVEDVETFAARVAEREAAREERKPARRSLVDRFGDPPADDPADAVAAWERALERLVEDVDVEAVDPSRYDQDRLEELRERESALEDEVADLETRLAVHDEQLRAFEARARDLATEPFVGEPETLSSGTADQLYLATRISLARQLLGDEPGFLLLDDAFLTAHSDRLRNGFEVLQDLAASGWQIVYFTSKQEVGERTVAELDLECTVFDSLVETDG